MLGKLMNMLREDRQQREVAALADLKARYHAFRIFLENNGRALELIVDIDGRLADGRDSLLVQAVEELAGVCSELVDGLNLLSDDRYAGLYGVQGGMNAAMLAELENLGGATTAAERACVALDDPTATDPALFGNKAATLAKLRSLGLPVPDGFCCSVAAGRDFFGATGLDEAIRSKLKRVEQGRTELGAAARAIRETIRTTPVPAPLLEALKTGYDRLLQDHAASSGGISISVRSSGLSEDGREFSFAGQYASVLNVRDFDSLLDAYRLVLAGGFSARAVSYRKNAGMSPADLDLAVLCQVMCTPSCAGVLFTHDPARPESGRMVISAVPGLGKSAVDGSAPADIYRPPRLEQVCRPEAGGTDPAPAGRDRPEIDVDRLMQGAVIPRKTSREVSAPSGGTHTEPYPPEHAALPLLAPDVLGELVRLGGIVESLEHTPQDIEWAWSEADGIAILQARPLRLSAPHAGTRLKLPTVAAPLLTGTCASSGRTVGRVATARSAAELHRLHVAATSDAPRPPLILVLPQSIVDAAPLIPGCDGVIIDIGNPTDHLSCIAREHGIPMITGTENALSCLKDGEWIIVDADRGFISRAPESVKTKTVRSAPRTNALPGKHTEEPADSAETGGNRVLTPERTRLRNMIVPLNLTAEFGPTFSFQECRSVHDLVRYTHEMAVLSMFDAGDRVMEEAGDLLHPLEIGIPFSFLVIDVGAGVRERRKKTVLDRFSPRTPLTREDILSLPLAALCEGLADPDISWHSRPDAGAVPGIMSRTMLDARGKRPAGSFNYALAARDYLNLNVRMEFHFAMLDAVCGRSTSANYIRFRFKGGGASAERSERRARFLQRVLEKNAFYTSVAGDLVTASLMGAPRETVYERLVMLGRLFGFSRFLDGVMTDDEVPMQLARQFLAGNFSSRTVLETEPGHS